MRVLDSFVQLHEIQSLALDEAFLAVSIYQYVRYGSSIEVALRQPQVIATRVFVSGRSLYFELLCRM